MPAFEVQIIESLPRSGSRTGASQSSSTILIGQNRTILSSLPPDHHADLPTYEEVIGGNDSSPPPSYNSIFGKVHEVQKHSVALKSVFAVLLGTVGCSIVIGVIVVIPISMIFFGAIYMNQCPRSKYIPVYLLIGGIMGIVKPLLTLSLYVRTNREDQAEERMRQVGTQSMLNWFIFGWFLIGTYWVYREYEPNYDPQKGLHCNQTLYTFAFWLITSAYILCGIFFFLIIVLTIVSVVINLKTTFNVDVNEV